MVQVKYMSSQIRSKFESSQICVKSNMVKKLSSQIQVKSNMAHKFSSQIHVKSNKAREMSSQIRVKSNIFDLTPIFDLKNAPSNNLPTPSGHSGLCGNQEEEEEEIR